MVVYSYKHLVFIGVVSKGNFYLGYIEAVVRVTSLHNISKTSKFNKEKGYFFKMSRTVLQTRTIIPLLRTSLLSKLSSELVVCTSRPISACAVCGNKRLQSNQTQREKILALTKTQMAGFSTKENQYPNLNTAILDNPGFRKDVVKFCTQLNVNIQDINHLLAPFTHESYLLANVHKLSGPHESNERLAFLGAQVMRKCVTEHLYHNFPELSAREIWDVQTGLLEDHVLSKALEWNIKAITLYSRHPQDLMLRQAVLALVGAVYTRESPEKADAFVKSHLIPELTRNEIEEVVKLQHPKFILQSIAEKVGHFPLKTRLDYSKKSKSHLHLDNPFSYCVSVVRSQENEVLAQEVSYSLTLAEKKACQKALIAHYGEEFNSFHLEMNDKDEFTVETDVDLGLIASEQRIVELEKGQEQSFGFHIKGGEKRKKRTEQWLVFHYTTPIFISHIVPGGVADMHGGLSVGDSILAVNDRSMEGLDHQRAVNLLKSVSGRVTLTVAHCKEALIADKVEMKYKELRRKKRMAELASDIWSDWHQAQANRQPSQYKDVLNYHDLPKEAKKPSS